MHRLAALLAFAAFAPVTHGQDITKPIPFDTPEADAIVSKMQVFPKDNPWNTPVEKWPLHPNSAKIVASVGANKPFRHNTDMGYILVPPDQKKIDLKLVDYPDESDKGPYPIPDQVPIEGWPCAVPARSEIEERHVG